MKIKIASILVISLWVTSCAVIVDGSEEETMHQGREIALDVQYTDVINIEITAGEVELVQNSSSNKLIAKISRRCDESFDCESDIGSLAFVTRNLNGGIYLSTTQQSVFASKGNILYSIQIPKARLLDIELGAGELDILNVDTCIKAKVGAGEARVSANHVSTNSAKIKSTLGEASLKVGNRFIASERFLTGEVAQWKQKQGKGSCDLKVNVMAGEATVQLN